MYSLQEYQSKAKQLADLLPWYGTPDDDIVLNKDGSLMRIYTLRGKDIESSDDTELLIYYAQLNDIFRSQHLGSGWGIWTDAQHVPARPYPASDWPHPVAGLIDAERRASFDETRAQHFETYVYLTLLWFPPPEHTNQLESYLFEDLHASQSAVGASQLVAQFRSATDHFAGLLAHIIPSLEVLAGDDLLTYMHSTVSTTRHRVSLPEIPVYLDVQLAEMPAHLGVRVGLGNDPADPTRPEYTMHFVSPRSFPNGITPAMLAALDDLPFPFRYTIRWLPLDKLEAMSVLKTYEKRWFSLRKPLRVYFWEFLFKNRNPLDNATNFHAEYQAASIKEALQDLQNNEVSYGYFTASIAVWDKDPRVAADRQAAIDGLLSGLGFVCHRETLNAGAAFLGMVPGDTVHNVRRPPLASKNIARLMPFSAPWAGPEKDEHLDGPPLLVGRTTGNQPFRYVLHQGGVGHQLILGPSGAGKTVLLNLMAIQFLRYPGAQVYLFDKERGFQVLTQAVEGSYSILRSASDTSLAFQPLGTLDTSDTERTWAAEWIEQLMTLQRGTQLQPHERTEVWRAITVLAAMPTRQRTLTGLRAIIQDHHLREMLGPYTIDGAYGHLFDADKDELSLGRWLGFEMADLLESPQAGGPALTYMFHRIRARFTGTPTLVIIDEGYRVLIDPQFTLRYQEALKEYRKLNVSVVFATQSIGDFLDHPIAPAILDNCLTRIYLPNAAALEPQAKSSYSKLGLSDAQIRHIAMATPREHYYYVSSQGNRLFSLDLGPVQRALLTASWKEDLRAAEELRLTANEPFGAAWLRYKGVDWAADALADATVSSLSGLEG